MAGNSRRLYIGVSGGLQRRVFRHKLGLASKFTAKYKCARCVYFEVFDNPADAIAREKQLKGWTRQRKIELINSSNDDWKDLFEWLDEDVQAERTRMQAEAGTMSAGKRDPSLTN